MCFLEEWTITLLLCSSATPHDKYSRWDVLRVTPFFQSPCAVADLLSNLFQRSTTSIPDTQNTNSDTDRDHPTSARPTVHSVGPLSTFRSVRRSSFVFWTRPCGSEVHVRCSVIKSVSTLPPPLPAPPKDLKAEASK